MATLPMTKGAAVPALGERAVYAILLGIALATRLPMLGDGAYSNDESFYFLVGQRMHDGFMPYGGIWDRKGPALFDVAWAIAGLSRSIVAFQLAGMACAALTAWAIARMTLRLAGPGAALFAGAAYLAITPIYGGGGAQSEVFFNLPLACAGLCIIAARDRLRHGVLPGSVIAAMAAIGVALAFKLTVVTQACFLGGYCLWQLHRGGMAAPRLLAGALAMIGAGLAPLSLGALQMRLSGQWPPFLHAMFASNLDRGYPGVIETATRLGQFVLYYSPPLLLAAPWLVRCDPAQRPMRNLLAGWILAAFAGAVIVPNFFIHYAVPMLVPALVAAGGTLERGLIGRRTAWFLLVAIFAIGPNAAIGARIAARQQMAALARAVSAGSARPRLFVYSGPVHLYALTGSRPPSPLLFPMHLFSPSEDRSSPYDPAAETRAILAWRPQAVVTGAGFPEPTLNPRTAPLVAAYLRGCRVVRTMTVTHGFSTGEYAVHTGCGRQ